MPDFRNLTSSQNTEIIKKNTNIEIEFRILPSRQVGQIY
jgi:hypothetical protein